MATEEQVYLLRTIAGTIANLSVHVLVDPVAKGSVMTLATTIGALIEAGAPPEAFDAIHESFCSLPHEDSPNLSLLFGGCLHLCQLTQEFDASLAERLSSDLFTLWQRHKASLSN